MVVDPVITVDWSSWVIAGASILLAMLTFLYVRLTKRILKSQSDPCVVLTVVHDFDRRTILKLVARNVGQGIARDIRFDYSSPLPAKAWGLSEESAKSTEQMKDGPLIRGIPALGPGETREVDWGQYGGLKTALGDSVIIATCRFKKGKKEMPAVECPLEVDSFAGTVASQSPSAELVKEVKKISKAVNSVTKEIRKLGTDNVSPPDDDQGNA